MTQPSPQEARDLLADIDDVAKKLWMAVFGGGGLFVPGLYIHWRWR